MHRRSRELRDVPERVVDGVCEVRALILRQPREGDSSVCGHKHRVFVRHVLNLVFGKPGEGEHPDLPRDEGPILVRVSGNQLVVQHAAHGFNATGHFAHLFVPALE